jgi:hypothetical protein
MEIRKQGMPDPWDMMQDHDVERFGAVIRDKDEQVRWCRAVFLGGLPYMWMKAAPVLQMTFDNLELRRGDKVLVIGESLESCGFISGIQERIGPEGEIKGIDIVDEARDAYLAGRRGRQGMLATWEWTYTKGILRVGLGMDLHEGDPGRLFRLRRLPAGRAAHGRLD